MEFICKKDDVPEGGMHRISRGRKGAIVIYEVDGEYFATADRCTHGDARLSDGDVDDGVVYCPLHAGGFMISTGEPVHPPCDVPIKTYEVILKDDDLYLGDEV